MKVIGTPLFQWEVGRQLEIIPLQDMRVDSVHFSNPGDLTALVVKPKEQNGKIIADIPNVLLQSGSNLVAYSVNVSADCVETLRDCVLPVRPRPKPSDYVYTETEVLSYSSLDTRLKALEGDGIEKAVADYLKENPIDIPDIPKALPNPHKLTIKGSVQAEYDGSKGVEIEIPEIPEAITIDSTLSKEGFAADAKATGEAIARKSLVQIITWEDDD